MRRLWQRRYNPPESNPTHPGYGPWIARMRHDEVMGALTTIALREEAQMTVLDGLTQALNDAKAREDAALARVASDLNALRGQISALTQQISDLQAQIAAGETVTEADVQPLIDLANQIGVEADAIDPSAAPPVGSGQPIGSGQTPS